MLFPVKPPNWNAIPRQAPQKKCYPPSCPPDEMLSPASPPRPPVPAPRPFEKKVGRSHLAFGDEGQKKYFCIWRWRWVGDGGEKKWWFWEVVDSLNDCFLEVCDAGVECTLGEVEVINPYCAVTSWSDWSPCSVSCGKFLHYAAVSSLVLHVLSGIR